MRLIQQHTGKRAAAVGDGGNDVSMIQAADTGLVNHSILSLKLTFFSTFIKS